MLRLLRIGAIAVGVLLFTVVAGWCVAFLLAGWLHSMMMNNPVRQVWEPRIDHAMDYFTYIVLVAWLLLFGVCCKLTKVFRGTQNI